MKAFLSHRGPPPWDKFKKTVTMAGYYFVLVSFRLRPKNGYFGHQNIYGSFRICLGSAIVTVITAITFSRFFNKYFLIKVTVLFGNGSNCGLY